jgi:hypothetical protein
MPRKQRVPIPDHIAAKALFEADRTCCVCRMKKPVQIHHIDDDPSNNAYENLAVLCMDCHRDTQIQGGFDRKLDAGQVKLYRRDWLEQVRRYRADASQSPRESTQSVGMRATLVRLEAAIKNEEWLDVARIYDRAGDEPLRDEYIDRALAENPSPFYQVLLRQMQGRVDELPEEVKAAAVEEVSGDWTVRGSILLDIGRVKDAAETWLQGIQEAIQNERWFVAAYYMRHGLDSQLVEPLLTLALSEKIASDDLWWQVRCYEELGWFDQARELLLGNESRIESSDSLILKRKLATAKRDNEEYIRLTKEIEELGPVAYVLPSGSDGSQEVSKEVHDADTEEVASTEPDS